MKLLLLTTCGTSVLTRRAAPEVVTWLNQVSNQRPLSGDDRTKLSAHAAARRGTVKQADEAGRRDLSAEINGIGAVLAKYKPREVQHLLVYSDTDVGEAAQEIIAELLREQTPNVQSLTAKGLRTDALLAFREALAHLTKDIEEYVPGYREKGWTTIFNLTGGFKSINAYMQALGMLQADRCAFIFETASEMMEIPRLPVRLADVDEVRVHLTFFRRLLLGYPLSAIEARGVPESLIDLLEDAVVDASVWGRVVWNRVRGRLLGEGLLDPLSPKLVVSKAALKDFAGLPKDRKVQVNEALDALSADLDGVRELLKSHTFKKLAGSPCPPSTHELYLWSDGATGRLFGHFENERFIADAIGSHL